MYRTLDRDIDESSRCGLAATARMKAIWGAKDRTTVPDDIADAVVRVIVAYNGRRTCPYVMQNRFLTRRVRDFVGHHVLPATVFAAAKALGISLYFSGGCPSWYITPSLITAFRARLEDEVEDGAKKLGEAVYGQNV